ncbi:MAG: serine/threonine protein kinase [Pyrinomonadaceae bacterium]
MKSLTPNTLLQNRYLIVQLIGKGGMGEVYLAVDQRLGSAVALKRTFFSDDEMLGNAFEREAKTLARLRHPVLPKVSDHFTENGTQYLAMEHISGDDLAKRLEITNKPFPLSWVLFWSDQLLDALAYLHSYEPPIVHRDIKPQNLKLTDENHIVLLDFGLAKNSIDNTRVTSTGSSVVGYTPHYAPMEQIRGTGTNPRSDLYSLSATVYQLLTNTVPPDALTRADSVLNGLPDPVKPLNQVNSEIPKMISDVILKGMSLAMEQRYANAREMQKALREAYAGMQNAMSAQTVAFNKSDSENQSQPPIGNLPAASGQTSARNNYQSKTEDVPALTQPNISSAPAAQNFAAQDDFDATMKDAPQSFGIKTEVLPFEKMPRAENYASPSTRENEFNVSPTSTQEKESAADDFSFAPEDDFSSGKEKGFDPNATFPLINFDKESAKPSASPNFNADVEGEEIYTPSDNYSPAVATVEAAASGRENVAPPPVQSALQKKSGGKALAVGGGIAAFAIIVIAGAAIGWYVLRPSAATTVTSTPTPVVESTPTPIASPTVEPTVEAVTNSNSSSDVVTSDSSNTNTNLVKTDVTVNDTRPQNDKPVQTVPVRATPTPRIVVLTTPRPAPTAKTPAAQKTPVKTDRTDILQ